MCMRYWFGVRGIYETSKLTRALPGYLVLCVERKKSLVVIRRKKIFVTYL